jgi:hypothetical protein
MQVKTAAGPSVEVDESEVLRCAGRIFAARRKHFGGPPKKPFTCAWCDQTFLGHAALESHQRAGCAESLGAAMGLPRLQDLLG